MEGIIFRTPLISLMDKQRFIAFRTDLEKLRDLVKGNQSPQYVDHVFFYLVKRYPELAARPENLPNLKVGPCTASSQKKSDADIKDELLRSIDITGFMKHTKIKVVLDNEETCLDSLRSLEVAIKDSRKRIVSFSYLQGQVLKRLQDIKGKKMTAILKLTPYSRSQAYFLINLYKLVQKCNKIKYSNLPLRFFKTNFKIIAGICDSEPELFM